MDGLKEDADILFVLATNRPEQLEGALAGRPGRIDQAIEVPLPDEIGRGKLVRLYGKGLPLDQTVIGEVARRTEGVSAAFIEGADAGASRKAVLRATAATRSFQPTSTKRLMTCCSPAVVSIEIARRGARARTPNPFSSQRDRLVAAAFGGFRHGFGPGARAQLAEQGFDMEFHGVQ
jgi:SpoVK/Ycf46/Vps4 family AAA+-type ATPase